MQVSTLHGIRISLDAGFAAAHPNDLTGMPNGDTLQIKATGGTLRVVFTPWPFLEPANSKYEVTTSNPLTFHNDGPNVLDFTFDCHFTPAATGIEAVYAGTEGGHGSVKPPGS
ncbi:MAG TPA: hypothetical protein VMG82_18035 [Candidatus Sulfotelmatobacter sp.]|nr:hypothetical protein [Candidatus Sulfotelmatobacter sp.]